MMTLLLLAQDPMDNHHLAAVARVEYPGAVLFEISYTPTGVHRAYLAHQRSLADNLMELPEVAFHEQEARELLQRVFGARVDLVAFPPADLVATAGELVS